MIESYEDFNIMRQFVLVIAFCFISILVSAQAPSPDNQPQRTVDEVALKQTEMLVRELNLTDSLQRDSLYRMHLKYAIERRTNNTRGAELDRLQRLTEELKGILTAEQFERFINRPVDDHPRRPHSVYGPMQPHHHPGEMPPPPPSGEGPHRQPTPSEHPQ